MPTRFDPRERLFGSLLGGRVAQWSSRGIIKSFQVVTSQIANGASSGTGTLSPTVNMNNTLLLWMGQQSNESAANENDFLAYSTLTSGTTITSTRQGTGAFTCTPRALAIEFQPGVLKSCQYTTATATGALTGVATITAVDITKAAPLMLGYNSSRNSGSGAITGMEWDFDLVLTNATTVTATHQSAAGTWTVGIVVPEWY